MKKNNLLKIIVLLLAAAAAVYFYNNFKIVKKNAADNSVLTTESVENVDNEENSNSSETLSIDRLTEENRVAAYVSKYGKLPDCYITKSEASRSGWTASEGNLCDVLPGRAIGGDRFGNREGQLPEKAGRQYFEADINYNCGRRGGERLVFSNDGLIFVTHNHYKTFEELKTEN
jgi:hypothetical protein